VPRSFRISAVIFVAIVVGGGIAVSVAFGSVAYVAVCLLGASLSVASARWFLRKTGLDRYYEEIEREAASRRARDRERPDAR
jgi:hypothetical protein